MTEHDDPDLGSRPDAVIEPVEPNPGGVDAVPLDDGEPVPADLPVELNPAVDSASTPALREGADTSTSATDGEPTDPASEAPA